VLPDAKISLWPFLAQKMANLVEKKSPKPNLAALLSQKIIVDTQLNKTLTKDNQH
jgi:hypothetical protein